MHKQITLLPLFVYGSLRRGFQHPAYAYISRYFTLIGEGKVQGKLYDMGSYPAALPVTGDFFIRGELYRINHPDEFEWAMAQLDDYEGIVPEPGESALYRREQAIVRLDNGSTELAWIYWFNGTVDERSWTGTEDLLQYMQWKNNQQS
jgi:gamma-glutamylcyclotransferase (GGCT)/AIG2-like uncharacterized protein YtfP